MSHRMLAIGPDEWIMVDRITELKFARFPDGQVTPDGRVGHWMISYTGASGCGCWSGISDEYAHSVLAELAGDRELTLHLARTKEKKR